LNQHIKKERGLEGIIIVNKPSGMTSHDVVLRVRRVLGIRRVGHAGTLDPLATGILIILIGKATKLFSRFESFDKGYRATLLLGTRTRSADIQGDVLRREPYEKITRDQVESALQRFVGEIDQLPPMVSAVKVKGRRLYELARQGLEVERKARRIRINRLDLATFELPHIQISLECSKGTYVRQIAEDLGEALGCGACITQIERFKVGPFEMTQAVELNKLSEKDIRPWHNQLTGAKNLL